MVPTTRLVDELWGEQPPATAVKAVQVYVSQLRKALGDGVIETRRDGVSAAGRAGRARSAPIRGSVRRGPALLAGGSRVRRGRCCARRSRSGGAGRWRGSRTRRSRERDRAAGGAAPGRARAAAGGRPALGRHAEAVGELEVLVREHPLRERLRGLLMLALYRAGRQADALAVLPGRPRDARDELGLDPSQALQRLERRSCATTRRSTCPPRRGRRAASPRAVDARS